MGCVFRPSVNSIWSIWYCVGTVALNAYLIYLGIERYRLYTEMHWPTGGGHVPAVQLTAYVALHAVAIGCLPFFIAFALFRTGNLAGDNQRLGARPDRTVRLDGGAGGADCCSRLAKAVWTHWPPVSHTVHLVMAFSMLLAQQLMLAQLYKQHIMNQDDVYSTEIDFIFEARKRLAQNLPTNATFTGFQSKNNFELTIQPIGPKLLPILMNQTLFGISLEFVNFVAALLFFSVSYAAVFQRASVWFTFIFSCHLIIYSAEAVFSYFAFSILYRIHVAGVARNLATLGGRPAFLLRNELFVLVAYLACAIVLYFASLAVYGYGYNKFQMSWLALRTRSPVTVGESVDQLQKPDGSPSKRQGNVMTTSHVGGTATSTVCCEGYIPHVCAIVLLVPLVVLKAPMLYDLMVLYPNQSPPIVLTCIVVDLVYLFSWILLWLALTCKRNWDFKTSYTVPEMVALLQADRPPSGKRTSDDARRLNDLKDALLLLSGDEVMIVVDQVARNSIFRHAQRYGIESNMGVPIGQDVYWLKGGVGSPVVGGGGGGVVTTMNQVAASPASNRRFVAVSDKTSPEAQRPLIAASGQQQLVQRRPSDEQRQVQQYVAYQTIGSPRHHQQPRERAMGGSFSRGYEPGQQQHQQPLYHQQQLQQQQQDNAVVSSFGTLPRGDYKGRQRMVMQGSTASDLQYNGRPTLVAQQRYQQVPSADTFYASIHKQQRPPSNASSVTTMHPQQEAMAGYTRYAQPPPPPPDNTSMASRGSSYVNVNQPSHYYQPPVQQQQQMIRQPPQARVIHRSDSGGTAMTPRGGQPGYAYTATGPTAVRQSPVLDRNGRQHAQLQNPSTSLDAYHRGGGPAGAAAAPTTVKLSSFGTVDSRSSANDGSVGKATNVMYNGGASREVTPLSQASSTLTRGNVAGASAAYNNHNGGNNNPPQQQQQTPPVQWHGNPMYGHDMDASSSTATGEDNCTPSSTLTSHGSYAINTPTPGSPQHVAVDNYGTLTPLKANNGGVMTGGGMTGGGVAGQRGAAVTGRQLSNTSYGGGQQAPPTHTERNDSANFSLTSSNESAPAAGDVHHHGGGGEGTAQFSTSIV